ncbi:hypothetical protein REPUB_Repub13aG0270300 [Reevesia pubescens]
MGQPLPCVHLGLLLPQMETKTLDREINVTQSTNEFSFGEIVLTGSLNHIVRIPVSIRPVSIV